MCSLQQPSAGTDSYLERFVGDNAPLKILLLNSQSQAAVAENPLLSKEGNSQAQEQIHTWNVLLETMLLSKSFC